MNESIGKRISRLRKEKAMSQETLAFKLGVSSQAVSKWENDQSCPDIALLPSLAKILEVTVDELLTGKSDKVQILPESQRKPLDQLTLRVRILSSDGDKVKVNLPMTLVKIAMEMGLDIGTQYVQDIDLRKLDMSQIMDMVERGAIGKLVEIESAEGDTIEVVVE